MTGSPKSRCWCRWDDEDDKSYEVPRYLDCDACGAVAWQLRRSVRTAEASQSGRRLSEAQLMEIFEDRTCTKETFAPYGLKNPQGGTQRVLDGPGAEGAGLKGGRVSGGTFPNKLARRCAEIVGEFDEMELYSLLGDGGATEADEVLIKQMQSEPAGGPSTPPADVELRGVVCGGRWCESEGVNGKRAPDKKTKKKKKKKKKTKVPKGDL